MYVVSESTLQVGTDDGIKWQEGCLQAASVIGTKEVAVFGELTLSTLRRSNKVFLQSRRPDGTTCRTDNVGDNATETDKRRVTHEEREGAELRTGEISARVERDSVQNRRVSGNLFSCLQQPVCSCFGGADINRAENRALVRCTDLWTTPHWLTNRTWRVGENPHASKHDSKHPGHSLGSAGRPDQNGRRICTSGKNARLKS